MYTGTGTAHQPPRRRVVRRRSTLDRAYSAVLGDMPDELREPVCNYIETMNAATEARSELTMALSKTKVRWADVNKITTKLAYSSTG